MDTNSKKELGERIKALREDAGLTQGELAKKVGKSSPAYIAFIEAGDRNISAMDLMLIAKQLGTSVAELMGEKKEEKPEFLQALRSSTGITPKDKQEIEKYYFFLKSIKDSNGK